ncbi:hypothetical protein ABBQ32_014099 [Trebouxia sp. C0010 RCD-2024]
MLLWAEDIDIPLDTARQAVQHVHAQHMAQVTQHGTASHVALSEPLQSLMVEAVRVVTGNASFHPLSNTGQPLSPQPPPLASESAPRRSGRARNPVSPYWKVPLAAPGRNRKAQTVSTPPVRPVTTHDRPVRLPQACGAQPSPRPL